MDRKVHPVGAAIIIVSLTMLIVVGALLIANWMVGGGSGGEDGFQGESFREVRIDVELADVTIETGAEYALALVWDGDYRLAYELEGEVLTVTSPRRAGKSGEVKASVSVIVPEEARLERVTVDTGLGDILLRKTSARVLSCDTGLGDIGLYRVVSDTAQADTGMGNITWDGSLSRAMELNTGMGDIEIGAPHVGSVDGWSYELSTGMGQVTVNGEDMGTSAEKNGEGAGELIATSGMGNIMFFRWKEYAAEMPDRERD